MLLLMAALGYAADMVDYESESLLQCTDIDVAVASRTLVRALSFTAAAGEMIAVLGQNGCGKTLSLHTLAGLRKSAAGFVTVDGADVGQRQRQKLAKQLALLPQNVDDIFPSTVLQTALTGRHPHIGLLDRETETDVNAARCALAAVGLAALEQRDVLTLSGGERRRLAIAQILTQAPSVYVLDEPTNHLDPQHQLDAMQLFRAAADAGATVIASLHDVNLASRFADRCLLLYGDGNWELGPTADILSSERLGKLYETHIETVPWKNGNLFVASGNDAA